MNPWIEKYRPTKLYDIVLDDHYKIMFDTMVETLFIPHMLLYGPPGTGKTTTINCLLNKIKEKYNMKHNVIHLNASDDRGVDIIRNTIYNFAQSDGFFTNSKLKFVILDEVDSMTKPAQQSLLLLLNNKQVRFFLICNYISKLIPALRHKCLTVHFYNIPNYKEYLNDIIVKENISITKDKLNDIVYNHYPDIRCMVNSLQCYKYIQCDFIKEKHIESLCKNYSFIKLKKFTQCFSYKEFNIKLFMYILLNYKIDSVLMSHMKQILFNNDIHFLNKVFFPHLFNIQN
jgi:DNA polymerase III delta prime subunit